MFRHITRQAVRNMVTKPTDFPRGSKNVGTNLPFNIFKGNALTVKFILFFCSAFYLPFFALNFQLKKYDKNYQVTEKPKETKISEAYKLIPEEQVKKAPEIYI